MSDDLFQQARTVVAQLQHRLHQRADPCYADWYRHNVKPTAPVRGVRMQDLRHLVMAWHQEWSATTPPSSLYTSAIQLEVTFLLFHADHVDDRLAAMVFLDEVLIPSGVVTPQLLPRLATLFPPGLIADFKACDHFAAKVLQPLLIRYGTPVSDHLRNWFTSQSVWQARAALSALTPLASDAIHDDLLFAGCTVVLQRPEEEAKSIVGSALRALGKVRPLLVDNFLANNDNLVNTNAACLNKATQFLDPRRQTYFREQRRLLLAWNSQMGATAATSTSSSATINSNVAQSSHSSMHTPSQHSQALPPTQSHHSFSPQQSQTPHQLSASLSTELGQAGPLPTFPSVLHHPEQLQQQQQQQSEYQATLPEHQPQHGQYDAIPAPQGGPPHLYLAYAEAPSGNVPYAATIDPLAMPIQQTQTTAQPATQLAAASFPADLQSTYYGASGRGRSDESGSYIVQDTAASKSMPSAIRDYGGMNTLPSMARYLDSGGPERTDDGGGRSDRRSGVASGRITRPESGGPKSRWPARRPRSFPQDVATADSEAFEGSSGPGQGGNGAGGGGRGNGEGDGEGVGAGTGADRQVGAGEQDEDDARTEGRAEGETGSRGGGR